MTKPEILKRIKSYKELQISIKQLEDKAEEIKTAIIDEMSAQNTNEIVVDVFTVKYKPYQTSRIDTTALKNELPDIAARYTKTIEAHRFTIT